MDIATIKRKTVLGITALIGRGLFLSAISFISIFVLSIILSPEIFGKYFIVVAAISILNYFSDIGLAAALIQKQKEPTSEDYSTTFFIQQALVTTACIVFIVATPIFQNTFHFTSDALWLLRSLILSFFLSSLKTIPTILLERELEFGKKIIPQIVENVSFYSIAITLAYLGYGINSFTVAAIVRGFLGLITLYIIRPWFPKFEFSKSSARALLSFGAPLQAGTFLALVKDDLLTLYLGAILDKQHRQIGLIGWAKKWSEAPLRTFMDNIIAISFPVYARLAHDKVVFRKGIEKTLFFIALLIFPSVAGLFLVMKPVVYLIPHYYVKWKDALPSFYLFSLSALLAALSSPLVQILNAMGKVKITFSLMVMWTVLTWIFVPFFVLKVGFTGVALSSFLIGFTSFFPAFLIQREVSFSFVRSIKKPLFATICMTGVLYLCLLFLSTSVIGLIISCVVSFILYSGIIFLIAREDITPYISILQKKNN